MLTLCGLILRSTQDVLISFRLIQIGRVSAEDKDSEQYNSFEYKLQSSSATDLFSVDSETGDITTKASLDREARSLHQFNVAAYDRQSPTMSSTAVVSVQVSLTHSLTAALDQSQVSPLQKLRS